MKRCPACGSEKMGPTIHPTVCVDCGHIGLFASEDARSRAKASEHWRPISRVS